MKMLKIMYGFYWFLVLCFGENFCWVKVFGYVKLCKVCVNFGFEWNLS